MGLIANDLERIPADWFTALPFVMPGEPPLPPGAGRDERMNQAAGISLIARNDDFPTACVTHVTANREETR